MLEHPQDIIKRIATVMGQARRLLFITGAGISADSGLPTYRGIGGLYNEQLTEENIPIELALSGEMLALRPDITWKYIHRIEQSCRGARFNRAHSIIAECQSRFEHVCVLTQNVDGFHREAGSRNLIEIHGDVHHLSCTACSYRTTVPDYGDLNIPPSCPNCGNLLRPDVVLFGELLPEAATAQLYSQLEQGFDMVFSIGTTSVFPYIAEPVIAASRQGIPTVEINPSDTIVTGAVDFKLAMGAARSLELIWDHYQQER